MSKNAWLTADNIPTARTTRTITVPDDDDWLAILRGCLLLLTYESNYEQFGTLTPQEMADVWRDIFMDFLEEPPMLLPPGLLCPFAGSVAPAGWLLCPGPAVSRTTYADLFAAIGTTYGPGDGSTTFGLPNPAGKVIAGRDAGQAEFDVLGETGGEKAHTLLTAELAVHNHTQNSHNHTQNSHNHTQDTHNHTQNSHNHTQDTHNHTQAAHTHIQTAHNHTQDAHDHVVNGGINAALGSVARGLIAAGLGSSNVLSGQFTPGINVTTPVNQNTTPTNVTTVATNQATTPTNVTTVATNQATTPTNVAATAINQDAGSGSPHNNLAPYITLNYIIKW